MAKKISISILWGSLVVVSYLLFSYYYFDGWWYSSVGTILVLFFSYLNWGKKFRSIAGVAMRLMEGIQSVAFSILVVILTIVLIKYIGREYVTGIGVSSVWNYYHDVFYILNEEIILGAIPLYLLIKRHRVKTLPASGMLALAFALFHFVFYKWIFLQTGTLELTTLVTLFMVAFIRNNLIISSGHIGYSWGLHFGWMAVMFGSNIMTTPDKGQLLEFEKFNYFLGSFEMLTISSIIAVISYLVLRKKNKIIDQ